jgi:hypothetical protein
MGDEGSVSANQPTRKRTRSSNRSYLEVATDDVDAHGERRVAPQDVALVLGERRLGQPAKGVRKPDGARLFAVSLKARSRKDRGATSPHAGFQPVTGNAFVDDRSDCLLNVLEPSQPHHRLGVLGICIEPLLPRGNVDRHSADDLEAGRSCCGAESGERRFFRTRARSRWNHLLVEEGPRQYALEEVEIEIARVACHHGQRRASRWRSRCREAPRSH